MNKVKVHIPTLNAPAIEYTFHCLLDEFLGLNYEFVKSEAQKDFVISWRSNSIEIKNDFFQRQELYTKGNIPGKTRKSQFQIDGESFTFENIYGTPEIELYEHRCIIHSDIIGATFFMLSRWEESVLDYRDKYDRFDGKKSLSVLNGFYQRPIVNEYIELLWAILMKLKFDQSRKNFIYQTNLTFDIDETKKWKSIKRFGISLKDNMSRGRFGCCFSDFVSYFSTRNSIPKDPFFNFDYILKQLSSHQVKSSVFYFKPITSESRFDRNTYDLSDIHHQNVIQQILEVGYVIGHHPGYLSIEDPILFKEEYKVLCKVSNTKVNEVRQHFLRFKLPDTWTLQSEIGYAIDSTMLYGHEAGFRNGVCYEFPVYDFKKDKQLSLRERSLLFMETTYLKRTNQLASKYTEIIDEVKKYNGTATVLWHNSNLNYKWQKKLFERLLQKITS